MKLGHTSDIHFGAGRSLTKGTREYLDRHNWHLDQLVEGFKKENIELALVSGDIFENLSTTVDEFIAAVHFFEKLGKICPVIATAGNHDEEKTGEFQVRRLAQMGIENVNFVSKPTSFKQYGVSVLAMPWTGIKNQKEFEDIILKHYSNEEVLMLHECFTGIVTDTGYRATSGVSVPEIFTVKYNALGDIHKFQNVHLPNAFYSGAPLQMNFGDKPDKGYIVVDSDNWKPKFHKIKSYCELHQADALTDIPEDTPHWWLLKVKANAIPQVIPKYVKKLEILPATIDNVAVTQLDASNVDMSVDYTLGVQELLESGGYTKEEIDICLKDIQTMSAF